MKSFSGERAETRFEGRSVRWIAFGEKNEYV